MSTQVVMNAAALTVCTPMARLPMETIRACPIAIVASSKKRPVYAPETDTCSKPLVSTSARKVISRMNAPTHSDRLVKSEDMPEP